MLHESVIPKLSAALGDQNVTALDARLQLAKCYLSLNQPDRAVVRLREYASGQRKLLGERSEQSAKLLGRIAALLFNSKQFAAAEEFARSALAIFSDFNAQTTFSLEVQCLLGESLHAQGRDAEAEPVLTAALDGLDRQTNLSPPMQQRQASATAALIRIYESTGRHDEAARRFPTTSTSGLSD
jgi:tetratricopeptide (TPR) repeat protein